MVIEQRNLKILQPGRAVTCSNQTQTIDGNFQVQEHYYTPFSAGTFYIIGLFLPSAYCQQLVATPINHIMVKVYQSSLGPIPASGLPCLRKFHIKLTNLLASDLQPERPTKRYRGCRDGSGKKTTAFLIAQR